jgi:hypothetical protein
MNKDKKIIEIKNWEKFQHYKHRNPPWIKLHSCLLDDYEWVQLSDNSKLILFHLWMLASRYQNAIPFDLEFLKQKMLIKNKIDLKELVEKGFLLIKSIMSQSASNLLASCYPNADPETEKSREEIEQLLLLNNEDNEKGKDKKVKDEIKEKAPVTQLIDYFCLKYKEIYQDDYKPNYGKDGKIFKDLLEHSTLDRVKEKIESLFLTKMEWVKGRKDVGLFCSQFNKLEIKIENKKEFTNGDVKFRMVD